MNTIGYSRIARSIFIAKQCKPLAVEAYKLALQDIKDTTLNTTKYNQVLESLNGILREQNQPLVNADQDWITNATKVNRTEGELLENKLKVAKSNLVKEEIRVSCFVCICGHLIKCRFAIHNLETTFIPRGIFQLP